MDGDRALTWGRQLARDAARIERFPNAYSAGMADIVLSAAPAFGDKVLGAARAVSCFYGGTRKAGSFNLKP